MPTRSDALSFILDPETSDEQLRRACRILGLDDNGDVETVRKRLLESIQPLEAQVEIVCLNPRIMHNDNADNG